MTRSRWPLWALAAAAAAGALSVAARPDASAADKAPAAADELAFVPADAKVIIYFRLADIWNHRLLTAGRDAYRKALPEPFEAFHKYFGLDPDQVDRFTFVSIGDPSVVGPHGPSLEPVSVLTTVKPYDPKAILQAAAPDAREEKIKGRTYFDNKQGPSFAFLDDRTFAVGQSSFLKPYLNRSDFAKEGPLAPVLKRATEKHAVVAGVQTAAVVVEFPAIATAPAWVKPLLKSESATLTVDLDGQVKAEGRLTFANEADAKAGAAGLDDALDVVRAQFVEAVKEVNKDGDAPKLAALLKDAQAALREAKAEQKGATVEVAASLKLDPDTTPAAVTEAVAKIQKASKQVLITNDLKQLALATINYADTYQKMPPPAITDKNGKPLLSWRVAILPYIEQQELYKQFHLDEPWDSEHNKALLEKMPPQFAPPDSEAFQRHETHFQAVVGKQSVFDPGAQVRYPASITDGTSNTILFVEAKKSVPWTKPEDVPFEGKMLPKMGGLSKDGFWAAFCDCHVTFLPATVKEQTLHHLITRDGGEVIPDLEKQR